MSRTKIILLPWALIIAAVLFMALKHFVVGWDCTLVSHQPSPDGRYVIHEFTSHTDGPGHAPYGNVLSLSRKQIRHPDDGHVIFAGYCKRPLKYRWQGASKVIIECDARSAQPIRTQAVMAYGIGIDVRIQPLQPSRHP